MNALEVTTLLAARLQTIRKVDGFHTDAGEQVFELVENFSGADCFPLVSVVFEGEEVANDGYSQRQQESMTGDFLFVGGIEQKTPDQPLKLLEDIKRAAFSWTSKQILSEHGITISYLSAMPLPIEDGDTHAEVQVRARLEWHEAVAP